MMPNCGDLVRDTLAQLQVHFDCVVQGERISIVTPFRYPDDAYIEIFVEPRPHGTLKVTDLGETLRHLVNLGFGVLESAKARFLLDQVTRRFGVDVYRGQIQKEVQSDQIATGLLDVIAAAQAAGNLIYLSKAYEPAAFAKEVSLFLGEQDIEHEYRVPVTGSTGKRYWVSIRVSRPGIVFLVEPVAPAQPANMTPMVNRVFRMWSDVNRETTKVSLLNDVDYEWKPPDVLLLERVSLIERWSQRDQILKLLRGLQR